MTKIKIRKANLNDITNLVVLKQQVWISTYAVDGIRNEFSEYVLDHFTKEKERKIIDDNQITTFVVEHEEHLIACVEIEENVLCPSNKENTVEIRVLYVLERFAGKGVGYELLKHSVNFLKRKACQRLWLSVYIENENAIQFYQRNSFSETGKIFFDMDGNSNENKIMELEIQ